MDETKKKAVEGIQAIMLANSVERDFLEDALNAAVAERYDDANELLDQALATRMVDVPLSVN